MIPKVIHYCWFGGNPLPDSAQKCIESWKKYCPDYEIRQWDENNFDIAACDYCREAYEAKKWAFVSDYARFRILQQHGGIYLDTDVELLKNLDDVIAEGAYMGIEKHSLDTYVNPGLGFAAPAGDQIITDIVDYYRSIHFLKDGEPDTATTVCHHVTKLLKAYGFVNENKLQKLNGLTVYPSDYFCPQNFMSGELEITEHTYSIHRYDGSWYTPVERYSHELKRKLSKNLPDRLAGQISHFVAQWKYNGLRSAVRRTWKRLREKLN